MLTCVNCQLSLLFTFSFDPLFSSHRLRFGRPVQKFVCMVTKSIEYKCEKLIKLATFLVSKMDHDNVRVQNSVNFTVSL